MRMVLSVLFLNISVQAFSISSLPLKVLPSKLDCKMSVNNMNYYTTKSGDFNPYKKVVENEFNPTTVIQGGGSLKTWAQDDLVGLSFEPASAQAITVAMNYDATIQTAGCLGNKNGIAGSRSGIYNKK